MSTLGPKLLPLGAVVPAEAVEAEAYQVLVAIDRNPSDPHLRRLHVDDVILWESADGRFDRRTGPHTARGEDCVASLRRGITLGFALATVRSERSEPVFARVQRLLRDA